MDLSIAERLTLMGGSLWPPTASYDENRVIEAIRKGVAITAEETERYALRATGPGGWAWEQDYPDPALEAPALGELDTRPRIPFEGMERSFNIGEHGTRLIKRGLEAADRSGQITTTAAGGPVNPMLTLYEKFVVGPERALEAQHAAIEAEIAELEASVASNTPTADTPAAEFPGPDAPIAPVGAQDEATAAPAPPAAPVAAPV